MMRPLRIITSGAQAAAIERLLPRYGKPVELSLGSSLGAARDSIPTRLAAGERFDLYFLAEAGQRQYAAEGYLDPQFHPLVESHIGAAVREDDPAPDISTVHALRQALLSAGSVAHAASASGIYLSTHVFPALGIAEEMKTIARTVYSERVGTVVARGEANLGFQQISEILPIKGVKMIGRLPPEFRRPFIFGAGFGADTQARSAAEDFLSFLRSEEAAQALRDTGLDPIPA